MKTTPIFGIPYAESTDPVREYPTTVDAPAASIIDTRLAIGRDTGWRNISASLINGWTSPGIVVRRYGPFVLLMYQLRVPATWNRNVLGATPTGFVGGSAIGYTVAVDSPYGGLPNAYSVPSSANWLIIGGPSLPGGVSANMNIQGSLVYATNDPWPVTLPGVPGQALKGPE